MGTKINSRELLEILAVTPADQNIMLAGRHGIGKSEILTAYFTKRGYQVVALFLGQMSDPGDLLGLPRLDENSGRTVFMPPQWFPTSNQPVVLFLDELNRARPEVLQTIMDLALNRKLAGRELPPGSRVISAVNEGDDYQLTDLDPALVSRFNIYTFVPTVEEWLLWAQENNLDERVIGFIEKNPLLLDQLPENYEAGSLEKSPDRRAWKKVADCLSAIEHPGPTHRKLIAGIIGTAPAAAFFSYLKASRQIRGEDVLLHFDHKKVAALPLHELAALSDSIFRYLELAIYEPSQEKEIADNLEKYTRYLQSIGSNEGLAYFAALLERENMPHATAFIADRVPAVLEIIQDYIAGIA